MHALLVQLELNDPSRRDEALTFLREVSVPTISKGEGFVSGTWMLSEDGKSTRSLLLYENEETAKAARSRAEGPPPPGVPARFVSAEVFEVMATA